MKINPQFKSLIPPLSSEEYSQLEQNLLTDGCREPLVTWNGTLVDGHNRFEICTKHGIKFEARERHFESEADAEIWIIRNQFGRRNLTPFVRGELALKLKPLLAEKAKENQRLSEGRGKKGCMTSDNLFSGPVDTKKELANVAGIGRDTMHKIEVISEKAPEEVKEALRSGETTVNAEYKKLTNFVTKNSVENEWYTPAIYIEAARRVLDGIDLDPASSEVAQETVQAERYYTAADDGLSKSWSGSVWLNPPYERDLIGQFTEKLHESLASQGGAVTEAILLTNNSTEVAWFQDIVPLADAICFVRGRISFNDVSGQPKNKPLQGQVFMYFGPSPGLFIEEFSQFGVCLAGAGEGVL